MKFSNRKWFWITSLILTIFLLLIAEEALARAGGGGGFGGGGRGGRDGGGGLGILIWFLIRLAIEYPIVGIPLLIIAVLFFIFAGRKGHSAHVGRTIRKAYSNQGKKAISGAEAQLRQRDPNFSPSGLADRVKQGFLKIQNAWSNQDMKPVRHLISDGIFERFSLQLEIQKGSLLKNDMSDINIQSISVVGIESDQCFDTVHISITASAVDRMINLETGKVLQGSSAPEIFTEYWSMLRRPGAQTLSKPGLMENFCPNCGNPIELADCTECPSCKALINSGEYDWVLAEITQESEWQFRPSRAIPGLEAIQAKDPAFNVQHVEDRVSVMFYRNIAAQFYADSSYLAKLAKDEFIGANKPAFTKLDNGKHRFFADAAVGGVEVVEIILSDQPNGMDQVRTKVKWSGHQEEYQVPSLIKPNFEASHIYTQEYVLERVSSTQSSGKNILTSTHCPNCGAPETRSNTGHCEYCQSPLNDGSRDWVLAEIRRFAGYPQDVTESQYTAMTAAAPQADLLDGPALSQYDNESIIACSVGLMLADGVIDPKEQELLQRMAKAKGVSLERLQMIVESVSGGHLEVPNPDTPEAAREFLRCMVLMCLMDGKVSSSERKLLHQLVATMGYSDIDIQQMITRERKVLYQQAKVINKS